jgi:hypothetical protein
LVGVIVGVGVGVEHTPTCVSLLIVQLTGVPVSKKVLAVTAFL